MRGPPVLSIVYRLSVWVSADKKFEFIGHYRYRLIRKKAYRSPTTYTYTIGNDQFLRIGGKGVTNAQYNFI